MLIEICCARVDNLVLSVCKSLLCRCQTPAYTKYKGSAVAFDVYCLAVVLRMYWNIVCRRLTQFCDRGVCVVLLQFARQHVASMVGVGPRTQLLYEILSAMHDDDAHVDTVDMLIDATAQTVRPGSITSDENDAAVASDDIASTYRRLDVDCHVDTMRYRLNLVL